MPKKKEDYYGILGVDKDSSPEQIKKAYRSKAMQYHPDRNQGDKNAEENFKKVSEAYEVLSDPQKKQRYDMGGDIDVGSSFNPFDIFSSFMGGFDFSDKQNVFYQTRRMNPDNKILYRTKLEDVITGAKREIIFKRQIACKVCFGRGLNDSGNQCVSCSGRGMRTNNMGNMVINMTCNNCQGTGRQMTKCASCNGSGYSTADEKIEVAIPKGISPSAMLKIKGKGNEVYSGNGEKIVGDTYIVLDYPTHYNGIDINHGDIYASVRVPFNAVVSEETIRVDILGCKDLELKLDCNKKTGHMYKIKGSGITEGNDAYVKVFIDIPKNKISEEDRNKLINVMRDIYGKSTIRFTPEDTIDYR